MSSNFTEEVQKFYDKYGRKGLIDLSIADAQEQRYNALIKSAQRQSKNAYNPSHKDIMWLIFLRTILELCIKYDDNGNVKEHVLTPTAWGIYNRIATIEKYIYNKSKALKEKYIEAHEISKPVWEKSLKAMGENYSIYIEPLCASLYASHESSLKKLGLISSQFMFMYDQYFLKHDCALEVESVKPIEVIIKETERELFNFKKEQKRKA